MADKNIILKHALKNAALHDGKANLGAVMNKVIGESETKDFKKLAGEVKRVISEIEKMSIEDQKEKLLELDSHALDKKEEKPKELPELEDAKSGSVIMRIAPNVNGPMHIGHSRGIAINWLYCQKYKGRFILKLDDTDADTKPAQAWVYDSHVKDVTWLTGKKPMVVCSSDNIKEHYKLAEKLIELGQAYTCTCKREIQQENRKEGKACKHRNAKPEEVIKEWKDMLGGKYKKGEIVLKIKTDMNHPNPAIRDWVAFRIAVSEHPKHPEYKVWPMMDFGNAIDDHILGMTHIIRGKELIMSTERQSYIYKALKWDYPKTMYWGRIKIMQHGKEMKISKSDMIKGIKEGKYTGWDDPRLPTLAGMRKRGIKPEAIIEFWKEIGLSERDISADLDKLDKMNQKYL